MSRVSPVQSEEATLGGSYFIVGIVIYIVDSSCITTYGLMALGREMSTRLNSSRSSVRITKMLMGGLVFASEASEKKFSGPCWGAGKS